MVILNQISQITIMIRKDRKEVNKQINKIIHLAGLRVKYKGLENLFSSLREVIPGSIDLATISILNNMIFFL